MNNVSTSVQSLFNLALNELSYSMNEDLLKSILKCYPTSIIYEILRKTLHTQDENHKFVHYSYFDSMKASVYDKGKQLVFMLLTDRYVMETQNEVLDKYTESQQPMFLDKFNFCNYFDLELFFKLIEYTSHRNDLFVLFQMCVQKKGLEFPKQFAKIWIESKTEDEINLHYIERGLTLGIFLGDSGWFSESAFVLSYIYKIISTKWVYSDQNLKLTQSIQCLTKWLLVVTYYYDFDEAKVVLSHILNNIKVVEQSEERHLHIISAYIAVSEYYSVIMDYDKSWLWASKAVNELHDEICDYWKLLVMSQFVKICSLTNKLTMAQSIKEKLFLDTSNVNTIYSIDIFRNIAHSFIQEGLINFQNYFVALDTSRNLFGYYNLHTANIFVDYAYARYIIHFLGSEITHVMSSVTQGIYIMEKIGIPDDNLMLVNARMLKSFMLQKIIFFNITYPHTLGMTIQVTNLLRNSMRESESYHIRAVQLSEKTFGKESMVTARSLNFLGQLYQEQYRLMSYKISQLNNIGQFRISRNTLNGETQSHLHYLQTNLKELIKKAEQTFLRSIKIYETICGPDYFMLLYLYQRLLTLYSTLNYYDKHQACFKKISSINEKMLKKEEFSSLNHKKYGNCLKKFKSLESLKKIIIDNID